MLAGKSPWRADAKPSREALDAHLGSTVGPLQEVLTYGEPRRIGNLAADRRWPAFGRAAIDVGYRSCRSRTDSTPLALSHFFTKPDAFRSTP